MSEQPPIPYEAQFFKAMQEITSLRERNVELETERDQLRAACAAKDEALLRITIMPYPNEDDDFAAIVAMCKQALSPTTTSDFVRKEERQQTESDLRNKKALLEYEIESDKREIKRLLRRIEKNAHLESLLNPTAGTDPKTTD